MEEEPSHAGESGKNRVAGWVFALLLNSQNQTNRAYLGVTAATRRISGLAVTGISARSSTPPETSDNR